MSLTLASYNIHRCYGQDGHYQPHRIRRVLRELNAQVIALQEVELLHDAPGLLEFFCDDSHLTAIPGLTLTREAGHYGNALLTSLPILSVRRIDLSMPGREPRGALFVTLEYGKKPIVIIATHLGLRPAERRAQIKLLLSTLEDEEKTVKQATMTVLMGDLNEWFLWGRPLRWLRKYFNPSPAPASFPVFLPVLALDRIWIKPARKIRHVKTLRNRDTRIASDHFPLLAEIV